jgi:hypothetical protein
MKTQPDNEASSLREGGGNDMARELAARLADADAAKDKLEAANTALKEEIERKNKTLEGFIAENEALKAELGGKRSPAPVAGKDGNTAGGRDGTESKGLDELVAQARRLGW